MTLEISCQSVCITIELSEHAGPVRALPIMHWALGEVQGHELIVKQCTGGKNTCVCGIDILSERLVCVFMYANAVFGPVVHAAVTNGEDT